MICSIRYPIGSKISLYKITAGKDEQSPIIAKTFSVSFSILIICESSFFEILGSSSVSIFDFSSEQGSAPGRAPGLDYENSGPRAEVPGSGIPASLGFSRVYLSSKIFFHINIII